MAPVEDADSGMESQEASQAQEDPKEFSSPPADKKPELEMDYDDEPDETLSERLLGLTEMFPDPVRKATHSVLCGTTTGLKGLYSFSRSAFWITFTTTLILFSPLIVEVERANMEEAQRSQQKQMLLGPNTAMSGSTMPPLMPPMPR